MMADQMDLLSNDSNLNNFSPNGASTLNNTTATDAKIESDLVVVEEKLELCRSLLNPGQGAARPSIHNDDTIRAVIGFLEACAPRLVELISADPGLLGEAVLVRCFDVQERLTKLLEQVETLALTETSASTTTAAPAAQQQSTMEEEAPQFILDLENNPGNATSNNNAPPASNAKTSGEEDPFGNALMNTTTTAPAPKSGDTDEFDDFFADRQKQGS